MLITSKINRLVAYGCSFTAGDELCEHELVPQADKIKKKYGREVFTKELLGQNLQSDIDAMYAKQKEVAYVGIVARKLGVALDNRARPGNSIESILHDIVLDIVSNNIKETDLVIVGLTHVDRILHIHNDDFYNALIGHSSTWPTYIPFNDVLNHFNNETLFFNYYVNLNSLIKICQDHLSTRFFIVKSCHWENLNIPNNISNKIKTSISFLKNNADTNKQSILDKSLYHFCNDYSNEVHGLGHPKQIVHDRYAEYLYSEITNKLE
jgi:hypothetical protein